MEEEEDTPPEAEAQKDEAAQQIRRRGEERRIGERWFPAPIPWGTFLLCTFLGNPHGLRLPLRCCLFFMSPCFLLLQLVAEVVSPNGEESLYRIIGFPRYPIIFQKLGRFSIVGSAQQFFFGRLVLLRCIDDVNCSYAHVVFARKKR